ncbi:MAG TPA: hypothetical protein HA346_04065 [Thermoplasmata archaeon]|nr:hypothetical protein [Thermoplasmata archaeon]
MKKLYKFGMKLLGVTVVCGLLIIIGGFISSPSSYVIAAYVLIGGALLIMSAWFYVAIFNNRKAGNIRNIAINIQHLLLLGLSFAISNLMFLQSTAFRTGLVGATLESIAGIVLVVVCIVFIPINSQKNKIPIAP